MPAPPVSPGQIPDPVRDLRTSVRSWPETGQLGKVLVVPVHEGQFGVGDVERGVEPRQVLAPAGSRPDPEIAQMHDDLYDGLADEIIEGTTAGKSAEILRIARVAHGVFPCQSPATPMRSGTRSMTQQRRR